MKPPDEWGKKTWNQLISNETDLLVDPDKKILDIRGTSDIYFKPEMYNGTEEMVITLVQQYWTWTPFWITYVIVFYTTSIGIFIYKICTSKTIEIERYSEDIIAKTVKLPLTTLLVFIVLQLIELADLFGDFTYLIYFTHKNSDLTFFLFLSLSTPFIIILIFGMTLGDNLIYGFKLFFGFTLSEDEINPFHKIFALTVVAFLENVI